MPEQSTITLFILASIVTLSIAESCSPIHFKKVPGEEDRKFYHHTDIGLSRECIEQQDGEELNISEKYTDYPYIKVKKVELLTSVCTVCTAAVIINELKEYCGDECAMVRAKATEAIGCIGVRLALCSEQCVQALVQLIDTSVSSDALVAISKIAVSCDSVAEMILSHLPSSVSSVIHPEGRAALIWILGEYGQDFSSSPYLLEEAVDNVSTEPSIVKLQLLTSVTKLFFSRAPECQDMLGRLLQHCIENVSDVDVRDRALLYYRLLRSDVQQAQRVVCSRHLIPNTANTNSHTSVQPSDFNTLAVMYGAPANTFISQQCPYTIAHGPCSKENALLWHTSISSQEHTMDNHPDLDELSSASDGHIPHILLDPSTQMSPGEFESMWLSLSPIREFKVHLTKVPSAKQLSKLLRSQFIMTMASSPSDRPVMKMFLYAQHVSTRHYFLVEVSIAIANRLLSFTLRCENNKQATPFVKHFFQTLGCHRTELPMLEWKMCEDVPTRMKNAKGVFFHDKLYLGGGFTGSSKADSIVYSYTPKLDMWKILPSSPLKWFAMAVFDDQIVLVGGKETKALSMDYTNKLASWDKQYTVWNFSLPPMLNRRSSPVAISQNSNLIVAGGNKGLLDYSVEVLNWNTKQWQCISQLPLSCSSSLSTVFEGHWYFCRENDHSVFSASISELLESSNEYESEVESGLESGYNSLSCSQDSQSCVVQKSVHSKWDYHCKVEFTPTQISHIQGSLIAFNSQHDPDGHLAAFSHSPETNSWTHLGNLPAICSSASVIATPVGVFFVGGDCPGGQYSNKMFIATV